MQSEAIRILIQLPMQEANSEAVQLAVLSTDL